MDLSIELGGDFAASSLRITLRGFAFSLVYGHRLRSTFFISASSTPSRADPELDPAHPCLDHHFVESLLQRSFESTPEVLRGHVGKFFVARHRLGEAFLRLVEAGLDLELPSFVTPANALTTLPMRVSIVLAPRGSHLPVIFGVHNARSKMVARLFSGLAYARHGSQLGFSELVGSRRHGRRVYHGCAAGRRSHRARREGDRLSSPLRLSPMGPLDQVPSRNQVTADVPTPTPTRPQLPLQLQL